MQLRQYAQGAAARTVTTVNSSHLAILAQGVRISLVAFAVAAFFHPIAYQFYFFCLAGLAVALVNAHRAEVAAAS